MTNLAWLFNALHDKLRLFPFHYKISEATNLWYKNICIQCFGLDAVKSSSKKRSISVSEDDDSHDSDTKRPKSIHLESITKEKESSKWEKLHTILKKVILYTSSDADEESSPSTNYIELLNCTSNKTALLLYSTVAANE